MLQTIHKLYTNYTLRDKELGSQRSTVNGQWSTVNGQRSMVKETKRQKDKKTKGERRKDRLFETFYPPIFKVTTWLSNCLTFKKREREAPLSWYTPRIFSWVIYFQCKGTKILFIWPNKSSFISLILYFLRKISSIDFYLKNITREGGLLKQEIYLWKSLFGKWFPH